MSHRMKKAAIAAVLTLSLLGTACSDGIRDAARVDGSSRSAAGWNWGSDESVNIDEFCSTFTRAGVLTAAQLATCFVLDNQTSKFTGPNKLGGRVALTVPKAECGVKSSLAGDPCVATSKKYGEIRNHQNGSIYGARVLTPNPFRGVAAIQFQSAAMYAGAEETVYVGSSEAPFTLSQSPAKAFFSTPYSADNGGFCAAQGQFFSCSLDNGSWSPKGDWPRPRFTFANKPMRITINNNSGSPMTMSSPASPGRGFLLDPVAQSNVESIAVGGRAFVGGYRSTNSNEEQSWTASYCVEYKPTGSTASPTCIPVDITVKLAYEGKEGEGKWVNQSQCVVNARTAAVTIKCDQPTMNDSDTDRIVTINVKNF
jgi:hypothetical protein